MKNIQGNRIHCQGASQVAKRSPPMARTTPLCFDRPSYKNSVLAKQSSSKQSIFTRCQHPSKRALSLKRSIAKGMSLIQPIGLNWGNLKSARGRGLGTDSLVVPNSLVNGRKGSCNLLQKQRYDDQQPNYVQPQRSSGVRLSHASENPSYPKLNDQSKVSNQQIKTSTPIPKTKSEKYQGALTAEKSASDVEDTIETPPQDPPYTRSQGFQVSSSNPPNKQGNQIDQQVYDQFVEDTNKGDECNNNPTPYGHTMSKQKGVRANIKELPPPLE